MHGWQTLNHEQIAVLMKNKQFNVKLFNAVNNEKNGPVNIKDIRVFDLSGEE